MDVAMRCTHMNVQCTCRYVCINYLHMCFVFASVHVCHYSCMHVCLCLC